jgi:putative transcriptional regulator
MMNTAEHRTFGVRIVGFEPSLIKRIRLVFRRTKSENWSFSKCSKMPTIEVVNSLWVVKLDDKSATHTECLRTFLKQTKQYAPIFLLTDWATQKSAATVLLREWLDLSGARVFDGKSGFDKLCGFLEQTAEREPSEIIVNVNLSDDGLHVWFADNARAKIPFASVKKIAEADDILWDSIRIAGDRTFVTLSTKSHDNIPLPHDVLREFVVEEERKRKAANTLGRKLTGQSIGNSLKTAREKKGLTQEGLAERVESSRWTIIRIEKGSYLPKVSLLAKLSNALDVPMEELLVS